MNEGISWEEVGSGGRFEKIVSVLLSTIHPNSLRIDGSGGDGGRDHQFNENGKLHIWQSKYFIGRLSEGKRKQQITDSLVTAAALQPDSWTLVTPQDPTPNELAWFSQLQHDYNFPLIWRTRSWLDAQLALYPAIIYQFSSENDKYVKLIRELQQEHDALIDGLPAARPRIESLTQKIDDSNPYYSVDLTISDGIVSQISLKPKYVGAERDSPIDGKFTVFGNPDTDKDVLERFEAAMDWGEDALIPATNTSGVTINAPHGLGGDLEDVQIVIGPADDIAVDFIMTLACYSPENKRLSSLPIRIQERRRGQRGILVRGSDMSGWVNIAIKVDMLSKTLEVKFHIEHQSNTLPGMLLAPLRFLTVLQYPNSLTVEQGGQDLGVTQECGEAVVSGEFITIIEALERVQAASGNVFALPDKWSMVDERNIFIGSKLISGESVQVGEGPITFNTASPEAALEVFKHSGHAQIIYRPPGTFRIQIFDQEVDLGPYVYYINRARLADNPYTKKDDGTHLIHIATEDSNGVGALLDANSSPAIGQILARSIQIGDQNLKSDSNQ